MLATVIALVLRVVHDCSRTAKEIDDCYRKACVRQATMLGLQFMDALRLGC